VADPIASDGLKWIVRSGLATLRVGPRSLPAGRERKTGNAR